MTEMPYVSASDVTPGTVASLDQAERQAREYVAVLLAAQRDHVIELHDGDHTLCRAYCLDQMMIDLLGCLDTHHMLCVTMTMTHDLARLTAETSGD